MRPTFSYLKYKGLYCSMLHQHFYENLISLTFSPPKEQNYCSFSCFKQNACSKGEIRGKKEQITTFIYYFILHLIIGMKASYKWP